MWNLRNEADEHRGRGEKREANHKRLLNIENKLRDAGVVLGGGWAKWERGIRWDTGWDEHWVL